MSEKDYSHTNVNLAVGKEVDDISLINSLLRCGVDSPTLFGLVWGEIMTTTGQKEFPIGLRKIVLAIIQEQKKKRESFDPQEEKIHGIIMDLLQVLYEKQVNDIVKDILER